MFKVYDRNGWLIYAIIGNYIALKFSKTRITANAVTLTGLLLGLLAGGLLSLGNYRCGITALFLLHLAMVSDFVDGTLARLKNEVSPYGRALDSIAGQTIFIVINLAIATMFRFDALIIIGVLVIISFSHLTEWIDGRFQRKTSITEKSEVRYLQRVVFDIFIPTHTLSYYLLFSISYLLGIVKFFVCYSATFFILRLFIRARNIKPENIKK